MPATRAGRALAQDAADYGVCDEYWCIIGYGYLTLLLRSVTPPVVSFNFLLSFRRHGWYIRNFSFLFFSLPQRRFHD
jgi:hypothetical protein